jgi:hypothetical protein
MKQALISPDEIIEFEGNNIGVRIAQVVLDGQTFPVGDPLYWMDCNDDVVADIYYLTNNSTIELNPNYIPPPTPDVHPEVSDVIPSISM